MGMVLGPNDPASKSGKGYNAMNKQRRTWIGMAVIACFLSVTQMAVLGQTYQAYHDSAGYTSPGFVTVNCQFDYTNTKQFSLFAWKAVLPDGWTVTAASGGGFTSWDIWLYGGEYYLSPNGAPPQNSTTVSFSYTISVPEGQTGEKTIRGEAEYWFAGMLDPNYVWATPDPLVLDNLNKTLQIVSPYGTGTPAVGVYTNLAGTVLSLSMTATGSSGPTQYVCTGWSMTGQGPASGTGNSFPMTVTDNAVLTWNWAQSNIAPSITNDVWITGYRTPQFKPLANKITEATLLAQANDPDSGDMLTLTSVNTNGLKGVIVSSGGVLTYTPPSHTDSIVDVFTYTVTDSKGASAVGTVKVRVAYGGTMIRAF